MTEAEISARLSLYLTAEQKILEGNQSWTKDGVTFERANISWIQRKIDELRAELQAVQNGGSFGCQPVLFGGRT